MARDEDIFRRLKKETPLVKQRSIQPLSQRDFNPKSVYNIPVETPSERKNAIKAPIKREPHLYSYEETAPSKPAVRQTPPSRLELGRSEQEQKSVKKPEPDMELRREPRKIKMPPKKTPVVFSEKPKRDARTEKEEQLDVFAQNLTPQSAYAPEPPVRAYAAQQDVSVFEETGPTDSVSLRHELKYYINYRDYVLLRSSLKALISPDPNADGNNSYHVRSLYFDDIYETALLEKIAGNDSRYKYRIRIYNFQDNVIKFEKKFKVGQYVGKDSISLTRDEYERIMAGDFDFLKDRNEQLAKEIYLEMKMYLLRPRVIVDYVREAYVSPFENCRITFDKDLRAGHMLNDIFDPQTPVMPMYDTGVMVLEVKFNRYLPEFIRRVLNNINAADRCAISKYVICRKYD